MQSFSRLVKWILNQYYEKMDDAEVSTKLASMTFTSPTSILRYFKGVLKLEGDVEGYESEVVLDDDWDAIQL